VFFTTKQQLEWADVVVGPGGSDVVVLDATHGTNHYGMQLCTVASQIGTQPVALGHCLAAVRKGVAGDAQRAAEFLLREFQIAYATTSPGTMWAPQVVMTDDDTSEHNALASVCMSATLRAEGRRRGAGGHGASLCRPRYAGAVLCTPVRDAGDSASVTLQRAGCDRVAAAGYRSYIPPRDVWRHPATYTASAAAAAAAAAGPSEDTAAHTAAGPPCKQTGKAKGAKANKKLTKLRSAGMKKPECVDCKSHGVYRALFSRGCRLCRQRDCVPKARCLSWSLRNHIHRLSCHS